jgi:hypothetical protein
MSAPVIPDTSPAELLARFRGPVTDSRPTYPERLHLEVKDSDGGEWLFATWESVWSPSDPAALLGRTVASADFDSSGKLTIGFSDGTCFEVAPDHEGSHDDIEAWELFTPEGLVLIYGPRKRWQLCRAGDPC